MALVITQVGLDKAIDADTQGISLKITQVAVGLNGYAPSKSQTSLQNELERIDISGGKKISSTQIHLTALFDGDNEIIGREVGFYLEDGTLFAVDSDPDIIIMYKSGSNGSRSLEAFDLILDSVPADSITVDVTGDLVLNFDADFQYIKEQIILLWEEQYPIGAPIPWATDIAPAGFAIMKGQSFDINTFTKTAKAYPNGILDDMRGLAVVGKKDGEIILAYEADGNKAHSHDGSYAIDSDLGNKVTDTQGAHSHGYPIGGVSGGGYAPLTNGYGSSPRTSHEGAHAHNVYIGAHGHNLSIAVDGGSENTVKNRKFNWIVRLA